jgi:hypothetical protein
VLDTNVHVSSLTMEDAIVTPECMAKRRKTKNSNSW